MTSAFVIAARRTAVAPRGGAFAGIEAMELAAATIVAVLADAGMAPDDVDEVILGNALYGGGNPARVAALRAGLPDAVPAVTIDSQCCAGLDAVLLAATRIKAGEADIVIAGGVESFSRAPLRLSRPKQAGEAPQAYDRPPFTPWPERDPDMIPAAAMLAAEWDIGRAAQEAFAVESHRKALAHGAAAGELVPMAGLARDDFTRRLDARLCARLPLLAGSPGHGVTAATIAVEADAAAAVLVLSDRAMARCRPAGRPVAIIGGTRHGGDPERPGLAPIAAAERTLRRAGVPAGAIVAAEIMEAFAVQAMACIQGLGLDPDSVNRGGGALARGHPIGASGAVLAVRLWHELQAEPAEAHGIAAIAAAGGLGSALLMRPT
ncbi:MAG: thiolase family protein [Rhizobiales bacterium]|nr:thiolase family protein [Hyphomicrobiales bacterium]